MKKRVIALTMILVLCMASALTGCGGKKQDPTKTDTTSPSSNPDEGKENKPGEPVVIRAAVYTEDFTDDQIAAFESENPDIKIERVIADDTKLMAMIAAGTAPDIIRILGVQQLPTYISRGLALNIEEYVNKSTVINKEDFLPLVNVYRYDGQKTGSGDLYGLPKDWSLDQALFINKQIFNDAGVPLPDPKIPLTYSELYEICKKVTKTDGETSEIVAIDGEDESFTLPNIQTILQQKGKSLWSDDFKKVDFDNQEVRKIFDDINELTQLKALYSPLNPCPSWFGPMFAEGKLAIAQAGYWFTGFLRTNELTKDNLDNYMMLPAPVADGGKRYSPVTSATGAIILRQSKHPDEAFRVMEYFFGGAPVEERATAGWGLPIYESKMLSLTPQETAFDKQCYEVVQDEIKNANSGEVLQFNPYLNVSAFKAMLEKVTTPVFFKSATEEDALKEIQNQVQALIDEGMDIAGAK